MFVVRRVKNKQMAIHKATGSEIESFTLLFLTNEEANALLALGEWTLVEKGHYFIISYESNDALDTLYKSIAMDHKKRNPEFIGVDKTYTSNLIGSSELIRNIKDGTIKIIRNSDQGVNCGVNKLVISDDIREHFWNACKISIYHKETGKWGIDIRNPEIYRPWSDYMNKKYLENVGESINAGRFN
jgi:hypothetical protein